jgi:hypothetical protein
MSRKLLVAAILLAAPLAAQQPAPPAGAVPPAGQKAVVPGDPNQPNPTIELREDVPTAVPEPTATATPPPPPAADLAPVEPAATPTVSGPKNQGQKGGARSARKALPPPTPGASTTLSTQSTSTVTAYEKGKGLTLTRPDGSSWTYRLAKGAAIPDDLAPGMQVSIETKIANRKRYVTRVSYKASEIVITNTK